MKLEVPIGDDPELIGWTFDLFSSLLPRMRQHNLPVGTVEDLATLRERLDSELATTKRFGATIGLVGAWSRKPD